jgi:O-antigen/teichoic acid export membrane protein
VMSLFLVSQQLGLYVVAVAVGGILGPLLNAVTIIVLPRTSHASSDAAGALLAARYVKGAVLVSLPALLLLIVLMPWALPAVFGIRYAPAVLSAQFLLVAALFQGVNGILGNSLRGLGRPGWPAISEAIGMVLTILILYALLPSLGILGAAIASLIAYACVAILQFAFVAKVGGLTPGELAKSPTDLTPWILLRRLWRNEGVPLDSSASPMPESTKP